MLPARAARLLVLFEPIVSLKFGVPLAVAIVFVKLLNDNDNKTNEQYEWLNEKKITVLHVLFEALCAFLCRHLQTKNVNILLSLRGFDVSTVTVNVPFSICISLAFLSVVVHFIHVVEREQDRIFLN